MTTLFLDIETTGIPPYFKGFPDATDLKKYENARALQISWIVVKDNVIVQDTNCIIKPTFRISNSHIHGITRERAEKEGMDMTKALAYFAEDCREAERLVCHNVDFDLNIIKSELHRANMTSRIDELERFCTMKQACRNRKWPKLVDLYETFFRQTYPAHNALEDAYACLRCYYMLTEKKDVKDEIEQARKELK